MIVTVPYQRSLWERLFTRLDGRWQPRVKLGWTVVAVRRRTADGLPPRTIWQAPSTMRKEDKALLDLNDRCRRLSYPDSGINMGDECGQPPESEDVLGFQGDQP
jgi:hypothetical protein